MKQSKQTKGVPFKEDWLSEYTEEVADLVVRFLSDNDLDIYSYPEVLFNLRLFAKNEYRKQAKKVQTNE